MGVGKGGLVSLLSYDTQHIWLQNLEALHDTKEIYEYTAYLPEHIA